MKKKFLLAFGIIVSLWSAASFGYWVTVHNDSNKPVYVREGLLISRKETLAPGQSLSWAMWSESTSNLAIESIDAQGQHHQISGCPRGTEILYDNIIAYVMTSFANNQQYCK